MRGRWRWGPEAPIRARPRPPSHSSSYSPQVLPAKGLPKLGAAPQARPQPAGRPGDEATPLNGPSTLALRRGSPASAGPFLHPAPPPPSHLSSRGACPAGLPPSQAFSRDLGSGEGARATSTPPALHSAPSLFAYSGGAELTRAPGPGGRVAHMAMGGPHVRLPRPPPVVKGVRVQSGWQVDQVAREDSWVQMCLLRGDMCYLDM